jgi:aspartate racemase
MKKTIGLLGGMGPLATADLLIKITTMTKADSDNEHIRVYIDCDCAIPDRTGAILHGGPDPVPEMTSALRNLEKCGADCIIMACNTAHYFLPRLQPLTNIPILDMPAITARRCAELFPGKKAALLGTTGTLQTGLYNAAMEKAGISYLLPEPEDQEWLMHLIYDIVKATRPMQPEEENWSRLLADLRGRGADYFILACTELPIVANTLPDEGPFIDPTAELAREAVLFCGYEVREPSGE